MRKRKRLALVTSPKPVKTEPLSDKAQLVWAGVKSAHEQAVASVNRAMETLVEVTARHMASLDDKDPAEWNFHVGTGQWVRKAGK